MKSVFDKLQNQGCDIDAIKDRFLDDEEFYITCMKGLLQDEEFERLGSAITNHELTEAFHSAHTLKGVIANMGIVTLYETICEMVELLRIQKEEGLVALYQKLLDQKKELHNLLVED